jgi:hypothetical protein
MIPQYDFYQALHIALSMVPDSHPSLPALASLLVECGRADELKLVGSDGERIVVVTLAVAHGQAAGTSMRLAPGEARDMLALWSCPPEINHRLTLCFMGGLLMVTDGVQCATRTALPGEYPDYQAVMHHKSAPPGARTFRRADMAEALAILEPVADLVRVNVNGLLGPGYIEAEGKGAIKSVVMGFHPVSAPAVGGKGGKSK